MQTWHDVIGTQKQQDYFQAVMQRVEHERQQGKTIYPPKNEVFNAFKITEFEQIKVVILGQDPYHGFGQAHGLSFSVKDGIAIPPSLRNIYQELANDIEGFRIPAHGNLEGWARQGVLLLNTVLTVQAGQAHSHAGWGWEVFTERVIQAINQHKQHVVFLLWGAHAQQRAALINQHKHCVLISPHPSPLSAHRGFLGNQHFSKTNNYLQTHNLPIIDWQI